MVQNTLISKASDLGHLHKIPVIKPTNKQTTTRVVLPEISSKDVTFRNVKVPFQNIDGTDFVFPKGSYPKRLVLTRRSSNPNPVKIFLSWELTGGYDSHAIDITRFLETSIVTSPLSLEPFRLFDSFLIDLTWTREKTLDFLQLCLDKADTISDQIPVTESLLKTMSDKQYEIARYPLATNLKLSVRVQEGKLTADDYSAVLEYESILE